VIEVGAAKWTCPQDVTKQYQTASVLPEGKGIIFNVKGNDYRMHVRMNFGLGVVLVVRIGTHKEYMSWTY
jgi:mRNA interferase HigB